MRMIIAGGGAAILIAVAAAVILHYLGLSTAELYSSPNVRL